MVEVLICRSGPYADSALKAYRDGDAFAVVKGVIVRRSSKGREPELVDRNGDELWRLDVDVISDVRDQIREAEYAQMAASNPTSAP